MKVYYFKEWRAALVGSELAPQVRQSFEITIHWYLSYLKRARMLASISSARAFMEMALAERRPSAWAAEQWREALNWFFRHAPLKREAADNGDRSAGPGESGGTAGERPGDGRRSYGVTVREYQATAGPDPMIEAAVQLMRIRHLSYRTEEAYIGWLRRFARFCGKTPLDQAGELELKAFLTSLAVDEGVSAGTQRQALNAGVFFLREVRKLELGDFSDYTPANPSKYYPVVYSKSEVAALLQKLKGTSALMAKLQYGCGLRVSELCRLRVHDVDLERKRLYVRAGKGNKDRNVPLPDCLITPLREHLTTVREVHERDQRAELPGVYLPGGLARKFSQSAKDWNWFWLFPAEGLSVDPRDQAVGKRRHHVLPGVYQRQLTSAAQAAGIAKRSNSHVLRHSFATHHLENGANIRTVQELLGHQCVETTMIYLHVMEDQRDAARSPLDGLAA